MSEIIPAVIPESVAELQERVGLVASLAQTIHIDVLPETFSPEGLTISMPFEAHLMVPDIEPHARAWAAAGAKRLILHKLSGGVRALRGQLELGLGVEMQTPLAEVYKEVEHVDFVQMMAIDEVGAQGRPFDEKVFARIRELKQKFPSLVVSVDGGVSEANIAELEAAGAERFVVGSALFKNL